MDIDLRRVRAREASQTSMARAGAGFWGEMAEGFVYQGNLIRELWRF